MYVIYNELGVSYKHKRHSQCPCMVESENHSEGAHVEIWIKPNSNFLDSVIICECLYIKLI